MQWHGFWVQMLWGTLVTLELAIASAIIGIGLGLLGALGESLHTPWLRYPTKALIFIIRGLPELLVLFFIYFGLTLLLSNVSDNAINVSPFVAGTIALSLIFGAYASQVFRGAFLAIDAGQVEAGCALGLSRWQVFKRIQIPQAWRHALPGLGNLWLVLLKDTAIVMLIGLFDLMGQAKLAASTTQQPFTYYLGATLIYLVITSVSQIILERLHAHANRYLPS